MTRIAAAALALSAALTATPATADERPTALLLNGFMMYQPDAMTPLAALAADLKSQGWRVVIDTHLGRHSTDEEPVLIIGHSAGAAKAYELGKHLLEQAKFVPTIITFDAALAFGNVYKCPVITCVNLHTAFYPEVAGATNIDASALSTPVLSHVSVAFTDAARRFVLRQTAPLVRPADKPVRQAGHRPAKSLAAMH